MRRDNIFERILAVLYIVALRCNTHINLPILTAFFVTEWTGDAWVCACLLEWEQITEPALGPGIG